LEADDACHRPDGSAYSSFRKAWRVSFVCSELRLLENVTHVRHRKTQSHSGSGLERRAKVGSFDRWVTIILLIIDDRVSWSGVADALTARVSGMGRVGQMATAGDPTMGSSLKTAIVSSVMWRER
jgi:hypothetical protein